MIAILKQFAPLGLYLISCALIFAALTGKTQWLLYYITGLLPLRNVVDRLQPYPLGKDLLDIMIILALLSVIIQGMNSKNNEGKTNYTVVHWVSLMIIAYTFISVLYGSFYLNEPLLFSISDVRVQSWKNFSIMPVLFFITFSAVRDKKTAWMMVAVMCSSMVLMDYYTGQQVMWYRNIESRTKIHATFVYLGPNEAAAFYNTITVVLLGIYFYMKRGLKKIALLALILMNLYIVVFLFSRAAYIGIFLGLFFLLMFKHRILLIPLILMAVSWQAVLPEKVIDRIEMTTGDYHELDKSSETRIMVWQDSLDLFAQSPIFGVGYGVFRKAGFVLGDTHNIYLKILAEQGIIGMLLFLALLFGFFGSGVELYRTSKDGLSKGLGLGFAVAIIVLAVNNVFGDRWSYMEVGGYMWIIAALVSRIIIIEKQSQELVSPVKVKSKRKTLRDELPG